MCGTIFLSLIRFGPFSLSQAQGEFLKTAALPDLPCKNMVIF